MQLSHIPLPSFTLVLTSGHGSLYVPDIQDDLMKTIDLRYVPDISANFENPNESATEDDIGTQTILQMVERPTNPEGGAVQSETRDASTKQNLAFLIHKFLTAKYKMPC